MRKKIVLIDMDGVVADFRKSFLEVAEKEGFVISEESHSQMYMKIVDDFDNKKRISINSRKGFYLNLMPMSGAVEAVREMIEEGFDIFFCSTPSKLYKNCVLEKYQWVEKHFGFEMTKKIILTRDKTLVRGDYLIDDKPEVSGIAAPEWEHVYFAHSYNEHLEGRGITDWSKWREVLKPGL